MIPFLAAAALLLVLAFTGRASFLRELAPGGRRVLGVALLAAVLGACVFDPLLGPPPEFAPHAVWFPGLFAAHAVLGGFLLLWWALAGCPAPSRYLRAPRPGLADLRAGALLGVAAWFAGIVTAALVFPLLEAAGRTPLGEPPGAMVYLAGLPAPRKLLLIASAMTVEEAFFRGFLQPRIGWLPSSLLFALAHAGYDLPTLTASVFAVSLTFAWGFERTGRLWPCVVAHGVFDAVQLLVVIPLALRGLGYGP